MAEVATGFKVEESIPGVIVDLVVDLTLACTVPETGYGNEGEEGLKRKCDFVGLSSLNLNLLLRPILPKESVVGDTFDESFADFDGSIALGSGSRICLIFGVVLEMALPDILPNVGETCEVYS